MVIATKRVLLEAGHFSLGLNSRLFFFAVAGLQNLVPTAFQIGDSQNALLCALMPSSAG
jgi:hypothetical protein